MNTIKIFAIAIICLSLCYGVSDGNAEKTIRLTNGEFPPYFSEALKYDGFCSQIVREAFASEGVTVTYGFYPWKRAYVLSAEGYWDGSVGWRYSEDRNAKHYYSDQPICQGKIVFFHRKNFPFHWESFLDLKNVNIGVTLGYGYTQSFQNALANGIITVDTAAEDVLNFRKLLVGRIDIFPNDLDVGYNELRTALSVEERQQITHHLQEVGAIDYHLILSKQKKSNAHMIKVFNRGFERLKASGRYDQILDEARQSGFRKE